MGAYIKCLEAAAAQSRVSGDRWQRFCMNAVLGASPILPRRKLLGIANSAWRRLPSCLATSLWRQVAACFPESMLAAGPLLPRRQLLGIARVLGLMDEKKKKKKKKRKKKKKKKKKKYSAMIRLL